MGLWKKRTLLLYHQMESNYITLFICNLVSFIVWAIFLF
jgi:hypothetical protein